MVEGARLESVYTRKGIAGSNPALSANKWMAPALPGHFCLEQMGRACSDQMRKTKMEGAVAPTIHLFDAPHPWDQRS